MKAFVAVLLIIFSALPSRSQSTNADQFRSEVDKEFAKFPNGEELLKHCDVCRRVIEEQVARRLGINTQGHSGSTSVLADVEMDVGNTTQNENEPSIAISRTNPRIMVVGANGLYNGAYYVPVYRTTDAGVTWHTSQLRTPNPPSPVGDAIVISDDSGNFYYSFLVDDLSKYFGEGVSDLMVARSTNNGVTWSLGTPVVGKTVSDSNFEDKETIAIDRDPKSPYHGRLYIAWNSFMTSQGATIPGSARHYLSHSDDRGVTWSKPEVYSSTYGYFAQMRVGTGGTLYIAAIGNNSSSYGLLVSTDGGTSFSEHFITDYTDYPSTVFKGGLRAPTYISFDIDPAKHNLIYAVYASYDNSVGALYTTTSTDNGTTWDTPNQIGSDTGLSTDHFFPAVSVDAITGEAFASLYSSEDDPINNINTRLVRCSFDDPSNLESFGAPLFNPLIDSMYFNGTPWIGDYIWSDAYDGYFATAWCQTHPGRADGDIFAFIATPGSGSVHQVNEQSFSIGTPVPNPAMGDHVSFDISTDDSKEITVKVFDLNGREVSQMLSNQFLSPSGTIDLGIKNLHAGIYRAVFSNAVSQIERSFIVVR